MMDLCCPTPDPRRCLQPQWVGKTCACVCASVQSEAGGSAPPLDAALCEAIDTLYEISQLVDEFEDSDQDKLLARMYVLCPGVPVQFSEHVAGVW